MKVRFRKATSSGPEKVLCLARKSTESESVLVAQSCPTICNHMDCSPPCSSVLEILQARILEWVAIPFRGSSPPRDQTFTHYLLCVQCGLKLANR